MNELLEVFLDKADESLAGAESEYVNGRYNNCANRCYYACFQAAIAALVRAGIRPPGQQVEWGHAFVQARLAGDLINRQKRYPSNLRDVLSRGLFLRKVADYKEERVAQIQAARAVRRTREFLEAIQKREGETR